LNFFIARENSFDIQSWYSLNAAASFSIPISPHPYYGLSWLTGGISNLNKLLWLKYLPSFGTCSEWWNRSIQNVAYMLPLLSVSGMHIIV
jgi:hypothetical protein